MSLEIPFNPTYSAFIQEVELDGRTFRLLFRWNSRESFWYLSLSTLDGEQVAAGLKLVPGSALLRYVKDFDLRPAGELLVLGTPDRQFTDCFLIYVSADEVVGA